MDVQESMFCILHSLLTFLGSVPTLSALTSPARPAASSVYGCARSCFHGDGLHHSAIVDASERFSHPFTNGFDKGLSSCVTFHMVIGGGALSAGPGNVYPTDPWMDSQSLLHLLSALPKPTSPRPEWQICACITVYRGNCGIHELQKCG